LGLRPPPSASAPAPAIERVGRREFIRRAERQAAERRRQWEREDAERRVREQQEREQLLARILAGGEP